MLNGKQKKTVKYTAEERRLIEQLRKGEIYLEGSRDYQVLTWLKYHEVDLNQDTIEAMAYLQDTDLSELCKQLTVYLCELSQMKEKEGCEEFFNNQEMTRMLRLMEFLNKWQSAELQELQRRRLDNEAIAAMAEA